MDTLVLGCTHYPLLKPLLTRILEDKVRLVDSADTCAQNVKSMLSSLDLQRKEAAKPTLQLFLTDLSDQFEMLARRFLNTEFGRVQRVTV